jgi:RNA polymerase sigma-70 factor (ECF subfamily)
MSSDQDQLLRLLLAQRAMLVGYITAIVRDAHLAEDVFQNVALVVLKKGHLLEAADLFPAWARKVARLEALAALRKQSNAPQLLDQSVLDVLEDHWRTLDDTPLSLAAEALRECVQTLTPRARRLIELRYVEKVRGKDLAERFARPANTVYVALSRIYRTLSSCVKQRLASKGLMYG